MPPEPRTSELTAAGAPGSPRARTFKIIFEHDTVGGRAFDVLLFVAILASVLAVMLESVADVRDDYGQALLTAEWCFTALFSLEYALRLWCVQQPRNYARSFFGVIDLLAVLPTYVSLLVPGGQVLMAVRILRVMRVFRVLKLTRYVGEASHLGAALRASRFKITVFLLGVFSTVIVVGSIMYLVEGPASGFTSIPKGVYWGIVTLTTVGFGDITPVTPLGQALAAIVMIMGYGIIAVPTGIVTAELSRLPRGEQTAGVVCSTCGTRETDAEARFCRRCGDTLDGGG
ncbi:MAG: ion transporter [Gemmatimonadota bacterium]